jgi:hypothetical protein
MGDRRCGAVGAARQRVHRCLRGAERVAVAHATASTVAVLMRSSWRAVVVVVERVVAEPRGTVDRLAGVRKVGIDRFDVGADVVRLPQNSLTTSDFAISTTSEFQTARFPIGGAGTMVLNDVSRMIDIRLIE